MDGEDLWGRRFERAKNLNSPFSSPMSDLRLSATKQPILEHLEWPWQLVSGQGPWGERQLRLLLLLEVESLPGIGERKPHLIVTGLTRYPGAGFVSPRGA